MNENTDTALQGETPRDRQLLDRVIEELYDRLGSVAHNQLWAGSPQTLNTQELVHEVYVKLASGNSTPTSDDGHFMAVAATAMRHIIIDHARKRQAARRGGDIDFQTLHESRVPWSDRSTEALVINELVDRLGTIDPRLSTTVECRYFAGYSEEETARILDVNARTVRRYWTRARNWLEQAYRADA